MSTLDAHLKALVEELSAELPEVTQRRMFGSDAFFATASPMPSPMSPRIRTSERTHACENMCGLP